MRGILLAPLKMNEMDRRAVGLVFMFVLSHCYSSSFLVYTRLDGPFMNHDIVHFFPVRRLHKPDVILSIVGFCQRREQTVLKHNEPGVILWLAIGSQIKKSLCSLIAAPLEQAVSSSQQLTFICTSLPKQTVNTNRFVCFPLQTSFRELRDHPLGNPLNKKIYKEKQLCVVTRVTQCSFRCCSVSGLTQNHTLRNKNSAKRECLDCIYAARKQPWVQDLNNNLVLKNCTQSQVTNGYTHNLVFKDHSYDYPVLGVFNML